MKKDEVTIPNKNTEILHRNKKFSSNKKAVIIIVSIILVMIAGVVVKFNFRDISTNPQTSSVKTNVNKQSADETEPLDGTTKNTGVKSPTGGKNRSTGENTSTGGIK